MCNKSNDDKINREHRCCIMVCDDEGKEFFFELDIAAILQDIEKMDFTIEYRNVINLSKQTGSGCGDPEYAMETDIEQPIIIAKISESCEMLVDGNHRLYKAQKLNIENIPCYVILAEYYKKFIINYDDDIYEKVVAICSK